MLFNSYEFIFLFLPIVFITYFFLNKKRLTIFAKGFLVFSSLFFYSYWSIKYLPIILASMLFNYLLGHTLSNSKKKSFSKKSLLVFGIFINLLLLGYFKYVDFFIDNLNYVFDLSVERLNLLLPLAISFFTFQQIAYLIDSYKKETKEYDFLNYSLFVTFFPQLIAGPIVHHKEMMPQFESIRNLFINYSNIVLGIFIFSIGLFKKVVIADTFSIWATKGFDHSSSLDFFEAWVTSLSYTFQLYFDFSGYSDMAIGIALLFNIKLPINFNSPYKALSIQDFWRRWHMTLSRFLRDYVYIPLGGNLRGNRRTYINLMATFLIGGLWHGAGWTFMFWGFLHGLALSIHRIWSLFSIRMPKVLAWFITFNFINFTWIFFRAKEFDDAIKVINGMIGNNGFILPNILHNKISFDFLNIYYGGFLSEVGGNIYTFIFIILGFIVVLFFNNTSCFYKNKINLNIYTMLFVSILMSISILYLNRVSEFLYFNF